MPPNHENFPQSALPDNGSDHALVIHVWHLDVMDDLMEAAANLPETTDQLVTIPVSFNAAQCDEVAQAFPRAQILTVENVGQDVGALFQLIKQMDLSRYDFICKIHTKKGPNMPHEWRRALLNGVLGSQRQVRHIIDRFRSDPQVMLAGARQLYVHGPSYLEPNAEAVDATFGRMIGDFDFRAQDWGFVAGTCFWIRTAILQEMAACPLHFQPAAHVTDGAPAHAAEQMFGLAASARGGKALLQDLRFPDRQPDEEQGFPNDLPRKSMQVAQILTPLAVNMFLKPYRRPVDAEALAGVAEARHRVAVFASYSPDGILPPQVIPYLEGLQPLTKAIVVVCDNDLLPAEQEKLKGLATHVITGRHGEYDFGSYKRGVAWAREKGLLDQADDLILCNDSCFGPVGSFKPMFAEMEARKLDFWGATDSHEFSYHLQSYFVVLNRKVFTSAAFATFIEGIKKQENVQQVILNYELGFTKTLREAGFSAEAFVPNTLAGVHPKDPSYNNLTVFPLYTLSGGLPLIKVKALKAAHTNADGPNRVLSWLRTAAPHVYESAISDLSIKQFEDADAVTFSIIMPTYNRSWCILKAISAVLAQTHHNFELIIVDDGSSDDTERRVRHNFKEEIETGRIRYITIAENIGVCNARNMGLAKTRNPWIAYADSDNEMRPYFLTLVANSIIENPERDALYARIINIGSGETIGAPFDRDRILKGNFIDLGVFVHRRELVSKFGGFDSDLKRLVDWDLCLRLTRHKDPHFISRVSLEYSDNQIANRISVKESLLKASIAVHSKHSSKPTVSTVIMSYNHENFIVEAIESALAQKGDYHHEILLSDDGSTDGTARIVERYAEKYPKKIRNISRHGNFGISDNYRHCFREAEGRFIAVLEGDDYWTDDEKNFSQAKFLIDNSEAKMVFSRIDLLDMKTRLRKRFQRQDGLAKLLTGDDIVRDEYLNPIANFSSTMFRKDVVMNLPSAVFEPRINEISVSLYMDRIGKIGFIDKIMGVYRLNPASAWTGATDESRLRQSIAIRKNALQIARPNYKGVLHEHLEAKKRELSKILSPAI